jgi:hypothetical protein
MGKKSGSGMNIQDHFSESLEKASRAKNTSVFDVDLDTGSGIFLTLGPGSRMDNPGSATPAHQSERLNPSPH